MRTTLDQDAILYSAIAGSSIKDVITGGIYRGQRPTSSTAEDIVIGSLPIGAGDIIQMGTSIVNIHVPDLDIEINGQSQQVPDTARLKTLCDIVVAEIEEVFDDTYNYWISSQTVAADDIPGNHFISIKITFKFDNTPIS